MEQRQTHHDDTPRLLQDKGWPNDQKNGGGNRRYYRQTSTDYAIILWYVATTLIIILNLAISSRVIYESFTTNYSWGNHFAVMFISCASFAALVVTHRLFIKRDFDA